MGMKEQFLREYQTKVLDAQLLPPCLSAQYSPGLPERRGAAGVWSMTGLDGLRF